MFRSCGCILYEMCCLKLLFDADDLIDLIHEIEDSTTPIPNIKEYDGYFNDAFQR